MAVSAGHLWLYGLNTLTATITLVELEWTLSALLGVLYSIDFLHDTVIDWRILSAGQPSDRLVVEMLVLIGIVLLGLHALLFVLGALAMTSPPAVGLPSVRIKFTAVAFTIAGQLMVLVLVVIRAKRKQLRAQPLGLPGSHVDDASP